VKTNTYRLILLAAATISTWACILALTSILLAWGWADTVSWGLLALAGLLVAGFALYRILFPHDHPPPRCRRAQPWHPSAHM
jgi:hypothetical protein